MRTLKDVGIEGQDLSCVTLNHADLSYVDLYGANLLRVQLIDTDLTGADLSYANLAGAFLDHTKLESANLCHANLAGASLCNIDLDGVELSDANLSGIRLVNVTNMPFIPSACPDTGSFIGYKKAYGFISGSSGNMNRYPAYIVVLRIPEDAKRSSAIGRKCRCDRATVLEIQNIDGTKADINEVFSAYNPEFFYKVGRTVSVDDFCENRWEQCAPGIHFFINREEAVNY